MDECFSTGGLGCAVRVLKCGALMFRRGGLEKGSNRNLRVVGFLWDVWATLGPGVRLPHSLVLTNT